KDKCMHGEWLKTIENVVKTSPSTASRCMRLARNKAKLCTVHNLAEAFRLLGEEKEEQEPDGGETSGAPEVCDRCQRVNAGRSMPNCQGCAELKARPKQSNGHARLEPPANLVDGLFKKLQKVGANALQIEGFAKIDQDLQDAVFESVKAGRQ